MAKTIDGAGGNRSRYVGHTATFICAVNIHRNIRRVVVESEDFISMRILSFQKVIISLRSLS
jgi:hypothetical protein